jgi:hypothetical protein
VTVALVVFLLLIGERLAVQRRPPQHSTIQLRLAWLPPELQNN